MPTAAHIVQTERDTVRFRLVALLVVALGVYFRQGQVPLAPTFGLILGYLAYSVALNRYLLPRFTGPVLLSIMILVDVGTMLGAVTVIGFDSPVFILLPLTIVYHSLYGGYTTSLASATLVSIGYGALALALVLSNTVIEDVASIQVPLFYLVAVFTGYLGRQRLHEQEAKQEVKEELQRWVEAEAQSRDVWQEASSLVAELDPRAVGGEVARVFAATLDVPLVLLLLPDEEGRSLRVLAASSSPEDLGLPSQNEIREPLDHESAGAHLLTRTRETVSCSSAELPAWAAQGGQVQALLALPVPTGEGRPEAVLYLFDTDEDSAMFRHVREAQHMAAVAGVLLGRLVASARLEQRSARMLSELRQTVQSMGRFRQQQERQVLTTGSLTLDPILEQVRVNGSTVALGKSEFDVLYLLAERAGSPVNKETLLREVWGEEFTARGNVVDVCVHRLRRKLAQVPNGEGLVETVRGRGYRVSPPS